MTLDVAIETNVDIFNTRPAVDPEQRHCSRAIDSLAIHYISIYIHIHTYIH